MSATQTSFAAEWSHPGTIPPRRWLYGRDLLRGHVTVYAAPGGTGKSMYALTSAVAMASGRNLLGRSMPEGRLCVLYLNMEDPADEFSRRIAGVMKHYGIDHRDIVGHLFVRHGRQQPFRSHKRNEAGTIAMSQEMLDLQQWVIQQRIDVVIADPFVSTHEASENSNEEIDAVAKAWASCIAGNTGHEAAVALVHHCRKLGANQADVDAIRGGKALTDAARIAITFNAMSPSEADSLGMSSEEHDRLVSVSTGKANMTAKASTKTWFRMESVALGNGDRLHPEGDEIGVPVPYSPPKGAAWTPEHLVAIQKALGADEYRESHQAKDGTWAGVVVANVMGLDPVRDRKRIGCFLTDWLSRGYIKKTTKRGKNGKAVPLLIPGQPAVSDTSWLPTTSVREVMSPN